MFLAVILICLRLVWRAYLGGVGRLLAIGILAAFAVILMHALGDMFVWDVKPALLLRVPLGLGAGFDKI